SIHFDHALHGHTLRLVPDPQLLEPVLTPTESADKAGIPNLADTAPLISAEESRVWTMLSPDALLTRVKRYSGQEPLQTGSAECLASRHIAHPDNARAVAALAREINELG